jgi:hypothetical protein
MSIRLSMLSSFFAVVLIVLTASPFTAPFQTIDLSAPFGEAPIHDGFSCEKVSKDCATPVLIGEIVPLFHSTVFNLNPRTLVADHPRIPPTLLRV